MSLNSKIKQTIRKKIVKKKGNLCCFCRKSMKKSETTLEHVVPISKGGTNAQRNLKLSCSGCNNQRGDMDFDEFMAIKMRERGEVA
jgi:5-methylcytosine-specific restriction endonuclease McrA